MMLGIPTSEKAWKLLEAGALQNCPPWGPNAELVSQGRSQWLLVTGSRPKADTAAREVAPRIGSLEPAEREARRQEQVVPLHE